MYNVVHVREGTTLHQAQRVILSLYCGHYNSYVSIMITKIIPPGWRWNALPSNTTDDIMLENTRHILTNQEKQQNALHTG